MSSQDHERTEEIVKHQQIPQIMEIWECHKRSWKERIDGILKMILKYQLKQKKKYWKTSEMMEGLCFAVCPLTGLSRPNTWKEEEEEEDDNDNDNNDDLTAV
jgi:hypothetical protein